YKIGHLAPSWSVRLKSRGVWEQLWGTKELLTSIDSVAIGRPPEEGVEKFFTPDGGWMHVDQGAGRVGLHAYQGAVYLETASIDDWVFEVMDGSHVHHEEFFQEHPEERKASLESGTDGVRLEEEHVKWYRQKGCLKKRVAVPMGGMVLWDSRLVHCNARPMKGRANPDRWRWVVIVCMTPASWADKASLRLKKKAYRELRMTTHWPSQGVRLFQENLPEKAPRPKHPLKELPPVAKTLEAMQLAGVVPYKGGKRGKDKGDDSEIPKPTWSPDYVPKNDVSSDVGWVVVAVCSAVVCFLSVLVYVYVLDK
ncbi:hypothetical protein BaRGS_00030604, partial [Batillaria attramentaria]